MGTERIYLTCVAEADNGERKHEANTHRSKQLST